MARLKFSIIVLFFSYLSAFASGPGCRGFYSEWNKKSLLERIHEALAKEPLSYPEYTISKVLRQELDSVEIQYEGVLESISQEGPQNPVQFTLSTINETLSTFGRISKSLNLELAKEKRNVQKISESSQELKDCLVNLKSCSSNALFALNESKELLLKAKSLLVELGQKIEDMASVSNAIDGQIKFPRELTAILNTTLLTHTEILQTYATNLESALNLFGQHEMQLRINSAEIQRALLEVALLQARGAKIQDAIRLKKQGGDGSSIVTGLRSIEQSEFQKHFSEPAVNTTGGLFLNDMASLDLSVGERSSAPFFRVLEKMRLIKNINPGVEMGFTYPEMERFFTRLFRNPESIEGRAVAHFLTPSVFGSGNDLNLVEKNLHLYLFLLRNFEPREYKDYIQWIVRLLNKVSKEVEDQPVSFLKRMSKNRHVKGLKKIAKVYSIYLDSDAFTKDANTLLQISKYHEQPGLIFHDLIGFANGTEMPEFKFRPRTTSAPKE